MLNQTIINEITAAKSLQEALTISGRNGNAQAIRIEYIKAVMGAKAVGGFFANTRSNVIDKFSDAYAYAKARA